LHDLWDYLIRKPCYPDENCAMPPRLRYFVYLLDFETGLDWECFRGCAININIISKWIIYPKGASACVRRRGCLCHGTVAQWPVRACFEVRNLLRIARRSLHYVPLVKFTQKSLVLILYCLIIHSNWKF